MTNILNIYKKNIIYFIKNINNYVFVGTEMNCFGILLLFNKSLLHAFEKHNIFYLRRHGMFNNLRQHIVGQSIQALD